MAALPSRVAEIVGAENAAAFQTKRIADLPGNLSLFLADGLRVLGDRDILVKNHDSLEDEGKAAAAALGLDADEVNFLFEQVSAPRFLNGRIRGATAPRISPAAFERVAHCLRALNQMEDLVLDKEFQLAENNKSIERRTKETLYIEALNSLPDTLQTRFAAAFKPFTRAGLIAQRAQRASQILQLRLDVIRQCSEDTVK